MLKITKTETQVQANVGGVGTMKVLNQNGHGGLD